MSTEKTELTILIQKSNLRQIIKSNNFILSQIKSTEFATELFIFMGFICLLRGVPKNHSRIYLFNPMLSEQNNLNIHLPTTQQIT